jgi:integrase/recombinase XerD
MKTYLDPEDISMMEKFAGSIRDRLLIRLLFHLGCRVSEALAIKVSDIDFTQKTITIVHLKTRIKISCPKCRASLARRHRFCPQCGEEMDDVAAQDQKHKRIRVLPIDEDTLRSLENYIGINKPTTANDNRRIFNLNRHRAWQIVRNCARDAGISRLVNPEMGRTRGVSPHRLRDAFSVHAMKLDDSGDSLRLLQEHLGHASFNTTAKYRKIAGEEHREWYERLWMKKDQ